MVSMPRRAYKQKGALARPRIYYNHLYLACLRIAAKPSMARRDASRIIAHSESVGIPEADTAKTDKVTPAGAALSTWSVNKTGSVLV